MFGPSRSGSRRIRGFTLVEILIVILILGILLAVAVPQFIRVRQGAQAKACQSNLKEITGAKERWAMDNQRAATDTPAWPDLVVPGVYLKSMPVCPGGGSYTIGRLDAFPTCSIGGTPGDGLAHAAR